MKNDADELASVGPDARPRPEVIEAARAALLPSSRSIDRANGLEDREVWQVAHAMFRRATSLRKSDKNEEAMPLYLDALVRLESIGELHDVSACLTGAGLAYLELARASLKEDLQSALAESASTGKLTSFSSLARQTITRRTLDLANKSRLCHLWALEVQKELQSIDGQAGRIANLSITESLLGNLDTARRYVVWALDVHRAGGDPAPVAIDLKLLADIDRGLGDEEAAAEHEREAGELSGAPSV
jgi:hypothetical protein